MADAKHIEILRQGGYAWNAWRAKEPNVKVDLTRANLAGFDLRKADFVGVDLSEANLVGVNLTGARLNYARLFSADLSEATLEGAYFVEAFLDWAKLARADLREAVLHKAELNWVNLHGANLVGASLVGANLVGAHLSQARLSGANLLAANLSEANLDGAHLDAGNLMKVNLRGATLCGADLQRTNLVEANFQNANLTGCRIYGISAWQLELGGSNQQNLVITPEGEPDITLDNIEVAQFIYLLLHNEKIRSVIDTITSKVVLILGRFTSERKTVLDALREELRRRDYLPILFDFDKPASRDITETISLLARMSRFVLADITDAKSIPQELMAIVPDLPSVPVQPLLQDGTAEYSMFEHMERYPWVLREHLYSSPEQLIASLNDWVILPAETKARELQARQSKWPE